MFARIATARDTGQTTDSALTSSRTSRLPGFARWAVVPVLAALLLVAVVAIVGQMIPGGDEVKIGLSVLYFVVAGAVLGKVAKSRPELRLPFRVSVLLAAVLLTGWYLESLRGEDVQESLVAVAPPAANSGGAAEGAPASGAELVAQGQFASLDHPGDGTAEVVRDGGALALQLRDFQTDAGPDLRVYLATDTDGSDFVDLGSLKGNSGNQRYDIRAGTDTSKYRQALIWCRAFAVGFTAAELKPAG